MGWSCGGLCQVWLRGCAEVSRPTNQGVSLGVCWGGALHGKIAGKSTVGASNCWAMETIVQETLLGSCCPWPLAHWPVLMSLQVPCSLSTSASTLTSVVCRAPHPHHAGDWGFMGTVPSSLSNASAGSEADSAAQPHARPQCLTTTAHTPELQCQDGPMGCALTCSRLRQWAEGRSKA